MCDELSDFEWPAIKPMLSNKPRGVPRVNDRRVRLRGRSVPPSPHPPGSIHECLGFPSPGPGHSSV